MYKVKNFQYKEEAAQEKKSFPNMHYEIEN